MLDVEDIAPAIDEAFHIATTGRPGPVLVDIPRDVQQATCEFEYPDYGQPAGLPADRQGQRAADQAAPPQLIAESEKPLILAGHGVVISRAWDELVQLAREGTDSR